MASLLASLAGGLTAFFLSSVPQIPFFTTSNSTVKAFASDVQPLLSFSAEICHPGSSCFIAATNRWVKRHNPSFDVVVRVSSTEDVQNTIRTANQYELPFLVISGGHGSISSLGKMEGGVGIWLVDLKGVGLLEDEGKGVGDRVRVGGGITSGEFAKKLKGLGKVGVMGACECTGVVAPMLGGGHGWLQGKYGLMLDQLVSATLVLGNWSVVEVNEEENGDLFWGLRGAGHNFGIVTEMEYKVQEYENNDNWSWEIHILPLKRLEEVFSLAQMMLERKEPDFTHWGMIGRLPGQDSVSIYLNLLSQSPKTLTHYTTSLNSTPVQTGSGDLQAYVSEINMMAYDGPFCAHGGPTIQMMPVGLEEYNLTSLRSVASLLQKTPGKLRNSVLTFEGYAVTGVQAVPEESTAYPDRQNNLLLSPFVFHEFGDAVLESDGTILGRKIQNILREGSGKRELNAYVNYANGYESLESMYGHEQWRLERLRRLKGEWDPEGRFGFYAPIK